MTDKLLIIAARNILAAFLLSLGVIPPSEDEDTFEIRDYGPHRVYTQLVRVPDKIDQADTLDKLVCFLTQYNTLPLAAKFQPYSAKVYSPCGCGTFLYVSICHTATA